MIEIPVALPGRRYSVHVGYGALVRLRRLLAPFKGRTMVVVSNPRIWSLHGGRLEAALDGLGPLARILIGDGEAHKSWSTLQALVDGFVAARLRRDGLVIAFGGGVVGDVAGFAAATYMRGVDWVQVPTTLLAMVDSSVGGKVAINHTQAKNLVGAFHQPAVVVSDSELLETLPEREAQSGAYEILKCAVLADRALFGELQGLPGSPRRWGRRALDRAIGAACRIKAEIVARDEREGGLRRVLNLGHTIGHALEAVTGYDRFTHGEAVGWGLIAAAEIARGRGLLATAPAQSIGAAVDRLGPRPPIDGLSAREILAAVSLDKKSRAGRVPFVLPAAVGRVVVRTDVAAGEVRQALRALARRPPPAAAG